MALRRLASKLVLDPGDESNGPQAALDLVDSLIEEEQPADAEVWVRGCDSPCSIETGDARSVGCAGASMSPSKWVSWYRGGSSGSGR